ncbi:MAG: hypothetical protein U0514_02805 [Candidatus Andersenbacteria bacterium]
MPTTKAWLPWLLLVVGLVVGAAAGGAIVYFVTRPAAVAPVASQTTNAATNATNTVANNAPTSSTTPSTTTQVPKDWELYDASRHDLTFQYPPEWGTPDVQITTGQDDSIFGFPAESGMFKPMAEGGYRGFTIATKKALQALAEPDLTERIATLDAVYKSKSADGIDPFILPPTNAGLVAATTPQYIQSDNGAFRGVYFYAFLTQNDTQSSSTKLLPELYVQVTNGTDILQFVDMVGNTFDTSSQQYGYDATFGPTQACTAPGGFQPPIEVKNCRVAKELEAELRDSYSIVVGSLE